jgi:hypothetical protein
MIPLPTGVRVWLATGCTDMRKGFASLSLQVQEVLRRDPLSGHLFCFRGRRGNLLKVIWHDGQGTHSVKAGGRDRPSGCFGGAILRAPVPGQQVGDPLGGMIGQSGQDISEPCLRIDVVDLGGFDEGIDGGGATTALV